MSTNWTLAASDICSDALQHLGIIGAGETPSSQDMNTCLRALDGILKGLPLIGYNWPKVSSETALVWTGVQTMALPTDYYSYPVVWILYLGNKVPLKQISHAYWVNMQNRATTAAVPTSFYIDPSNTLYLWPVPPTDPVASIQYQRLVTDAVQVSTPDMQQHWLNPLGLGVAHEVALKFGVDQAARQEIEKRWLAKRIGALENSIPSEVITISVSD